MHGVPINRQFEVSLYTELVRFPSQLKKTSVSFILGKIFICSSFFVWVSFGLNQMDSQPWPFFFALVFLISFNRKIPVVGLLLLIPLFLSFMILPISLDSELFWLFRGVASYSIFSTSALAFFCFFYSYGFPLRLVLFFNALYILVGLAQLLLGVDIFEGIVHVRTTTDRGVTSLTPEPTYFGMCLVFFSWTLLLFRSSLRRKTFLMFYFFNFMAIALLAKSAMAMLFIAILTALYLIKNLGFLRFGILFFLLLVLSFFVIGTLDNSRLYKLSALLYELGPLDLMLSDASVNYRVSHVVISFLAFFDNLMLPHGFGTFGSYFTYYSEKFPSIFWYGGPTNSIMSFMGAFLFELGFFGLMFFAFYILILLTSKRVRIAEVIFLLLVTNSALSVAFPFLAMMFAILLLNTLTHSKNPESNFSYANC